MRSFHVWCVLGASTLSLSARLHWPCASGYPLVTAAERKLQLGDNVCVRFCWCGYAWRILLMALLFPCMLGRISRDCQCFVATCLAWRGTPAPRVGRVVWRHQKCNSVIPAPTRLHGQCLWLLGRLGEPGWAHRKQRLPIPASFVFCSNSASSMYRYESPRLAASC